MTKKLVLVTALLAVTVTTAPIVSAQGSNPNRGGKQHSIQDVNHDGVCDMCGTPVGSGLANAQGQQAQKGKHLGPADGTGNSGSGPHDGTGYGAQSGRRSRQGDGSGPGQQGGAGACGHGQGGGHRAGRQ
jgi:hypothetical protein